MELFVEVSALLGIALSVAIVMRLVGQPLIIGHILTGLIVGPYALGLVQSHDTIAFMGQIGVAILLFTVGLHLSPDILRSFGRVAVLTGFGQVIFTGAAGYFTCLLLGFSHITSLYLSVGLAFSSTIIIMKLITDKGDIDALYAKIAIGFLLVQDLIAVGLLLLIPMFSAETTTVRSIAIFLGSATALIGFLYLLSRILIANFSAFFEKSQELLFLFALTWGVGVAAIFHEIGFSIESGALIAGVALATLPSRREISARLTPLRDFFIVLFFIYLGAQLQLDALSTLLPAAFILSALVLIGNPIILMAILGYLGYRRKTSLQTGFTVAQISEFSLILIALGVSLGHLDSTTLSLATLVGLITIFGSTYLVMYSDSIYTFLQPYLSFFERTDAHEKRPRHAAYDVVLFGCNRVGFDFLDGMAKLEKKLLVVDYDPQVVAAIEDSGIAVAFGDAGDIAFLETIDFSSVSLVVSTVPNQEANALINRAVKIGNPNAVVIVVAHTISDALSHYDDGVDYVVLPHFLGGKHAADMVVKYKDDKRHYDKLRSDHIEHLRVRVTIGHDHPQLT